MRIALLADYETAYYQRLLGGLREGFLDLDQGLDVVVFPRPLHEMETPLDWKASGFDVVLQINKPRPADLPAHVRHISWIQDIFPALEQSILDALQPQDIVYTLTDPEMIGARRDWPCYSSVLFTGLARWWAQECPSIKQELDLSILGYIPKANQWYLANTPQAVTFREWVDTRYQPLCGSLDLRLLYKAARSDDARSGIREYTRFLDRGYLAHLALSVSTNVEFHGANWERYPAFAHYARPHVDTDEGLRKVYQRSAINLSSNPNGFGVHSRQLECMAAGSFIMMHRSPMEYREGGMRAHFEPEVHYAEYSPEDFKDQVGGWLKLSEKRKKIGENARRLVLEKHLWRHRAQQVVGDLQRTT